jgi:hypothetical protein
MVVWPVMLSKSDFKRYLRCSCELWAAKQRPDLLTPLTDNDQRVLDEGNLVDALAQKLSPLGVNVDGFGALAAENTRKAIADGAAVLLQPTFISENLSCRADILIKNEDGSWDICEVKNCTKPKPEHNLDLAFQRLCLEEAGIRVSGTSVIHLDNTYVKQGEIEPEKLFIRTDATLKVEKALPKVRKAIPHAIAAMEWDKLPGSVHAKGCSSPKDCELLGQYFTELNDASVFSIANELSEEKLRAFLGRGLIKPSQISPELLKSLGEVSLPKVTAEPTLFIDKEQVLSELNGLEYPLFFLDYETFAPAIPLFDGYSPFEPMVFQYSLHVVKEKGAEPEDFCFIADELVDPAPAVAASLRKHIGDTGTVIVWHAPFETTRNKEIAQHVPEFADFMKEVNARTYDLMMIMKKGYYVDSRFEGSASIKKVLPVMCPELSYKDLVIQEGRTASASWITLTNPETPPEEKKKLKDDMLAYCGLDTYAMYAIFKKLNEV